MGKSLRLVSETPHVLSRVAVEARWLPQTAIQEEFIDRKRQVLTCSSSTMRLPTRAAMLHANFITAAMQERHLCIQMRKLGLSKLLPAPAKCVIMDLGCLCCNTHPNAQSRSEPKRRRKGNRQQPKTAAESNVVLRKLEICRVTKILICSMSFCQICCIEMKLPQEGKRIPDYRSCINCFRQTCRFYSTNNVFLSTETQKTDLVSIFQLVESWIKECHLRCRRVTGCHSFPQTLSTHQKQQHRWQLNKPNNTITSVRQKPAADS